MKYKVLTFITFASLSLQALATQEVTPGAQAGLCVDVLTKFEIAPEHQEQLGRIRVRALEELIWDSEGNVIEESLTTENAGRAPSDRTYELGSREYPATDLQVVPGTETYANRAAAYLERHLGTRLFIGTHPLYGGLFRQDLNTILITEHALTSPAVFRALLSHEIIHAIESYKLITNQDSLFHGVIKSENFVGGAAHYPGAISLSEILTYSAQLHILAREVAQNPGHDRAAISALWDTVNMYKDILTAIHSVLRNLELAHYSVHNFTIERNNTTHPMRELIFLNRADTPKSNLGLQITRDFSSAGALLGKAEVYAALRYRINLVSRLAQGLAVRMTDIQGLLAKLVEELRVQSPRAPQTAQAILTESLSIRRTLRVSTRHWESAPFRVDR